MEDMDYTDFANGETRMGRVCECSSNNAYSKKEIADFKINYQTKIITAYRTIRYYRPHSYSG